MLLVALDASAGGRPEASDILGRYWLPGRVGQLQIVERDGEYVGWVVAAFDPDRSDPTRPSPDFGERPAVGREMLTGFHFDGRRWVGGTIYDPKTGRLEGASLWFERRDPRTLWARSLRGATGPSWTRRFERVKRRRRGGG
jgi:hypothetical protein